MRILRSMGRHSRRLRDESGQALVEFAFVLIMMITLFVGMVDFARVFLQYQVITDAAREAARKAVVNDAKYQGQSALIFSEINSFLAASGIDTDGAVLGACTSPGSVPVVTVSECDWDGATGITASVGIAVPYEFALVGPFIGWATGDRTITLRTWFSMRNE